MNTYQKNWHTKHQESLTFAQKLADKIALFAGSWTFIILQTVVVTLWVGINIVGYVQHWDPYPFILLNLIFSTQAAYTAPILMMSQNRQSERDRVQAQADFETNTIARKEIEALQKELARIENQKLDEILRILNQNK